MRCWLFTGCHSMSGVFYIMLDRYSSFPGERDTENSDRQTKFTN